MISYIGVVMMGKNITFYQKILNYYNRLILSKNIKYIPILVLVLLGSISIYFYLENNNEINIMRLDNENLVNSYSELNSSYYDLQNNATILEDYYGYIKSLYNELYVNYTDLSGKYSELYDDLAVINSLYSVSSENYVVLQSNYLLLLEDYNNISNGYDKATKLLSDIQNLGLQSMLNDQENIEIGPRNNKTFTYNISYAGFLEINFTSSTELLVWVGSSAVEPNYYARYPIYPQISDHGSFQIPVAGDNAYIYLENPDHVSIANILLSVKYVY